MDTRELIQRALAARELAYAPYSGFCVGAALETAEGEVFTGCNIENSGFSPTNCAERTAFFKAVSEGRRSFRRIVVVGGVRGPVTGYCAPCGVCRQVMAEFCDPKTFQILLAKSPEDWRTYTLDELLPLAQHPEGEQGLDFFRHSTPAG